MHRTLFVSDEFDDRSNETEGLFKILTTNIPQLEQEGTYISLDLLSKQFYYYL